MLSYSKNVAIMGYIDLTLPEFQRRFSSENACLEAVFEDRRTRGFVCDEYGHDDGYRLPSRPRIVQRCFCRHQTSTTASTLFEKSKTTVPIWFMITFLMAQDKGGDRRIENRNVAWNALCNRLAHSSQSANCPGDEG